ACETRAWRASLRRPRPRAAATTSRAGCGAADGGDAAAVPAMSPSPRSASSAPRCLNGFARHARLGAGARQADAADLPFEGDPEAVADAPPHFFAKLLDIRGGRI